MLKMLSITTSWDREEEEEQDDEEQGEERRRRTELAHSRTPEPIGLGMTRNPLGIKDDEDLTQPSLPIPAAAPTAAPALTTSISVIDTSLEHLTILSNQLQFTVGMPLCTIQCLCGRRKFHHWRVSLRLRKLTCRHSRG